MVRGIGLNSSHAFRIMCDFIHGSDALGCEVVLVCEYDNVTGSLPREGTASRDMVVSVTYAALCYNKVFAFDIE